MAFIATIHLLLDVDNTVEAADAINEILREQKRSFFPSSCLVDYAVANPSHQPFHYDPGSYVEGEFVAPTAPFIYTALCRESFGKGAMWCGKIHLDAPIHSQSKPALEAAILMARQACSEELDMAIWLIECIGLLSGDCAVTVLA